MNVGDRVVVRINFEDQPGTITRLAARGRVVVTTDSGDCRTWARSELRKADQ